MSNDRGDAAPEPDRSPVRFLGLLLALSVPFLVVGALVPSPAWMPLDMPVSAFMFVCPLLAAVVLTARDEGRPGVRRLLTRTVDVRRVRPRAWFLPAALAMPAVLALSYPLGRLTGRVPPPPEVVPLAVAALTAVYLLAAAGEEAGWTAYATDPALRRWGAGGTGLLLGVAWALWHVLPWAQVHDPRWVAGQFLATVAARVLIVRMYVATGGAVAVAVVFHAMSNVSETLVPGFDPVAVGALLAGTAVVVLVASRGTGSRRPIPGTPGAVTAAVDGGR